MWKAWLSLAVAAGVKAMAVGAAGGDGDGGASREAGELRVAGEPVDPGDLADQLGRDQDAQALLGQQLRRDLPDEAGELLVELGDRSRQFPDAEDHVARDLHLHGVVG
jgi:hypothetical protein